MHKKLLSVVALTILVALTLVGCSDAPSDSSTLTILSITEGTVLVMKAGTDDWTEASVEMTLEVGDTIKTGDDSGAEITFFDGSTIELEAGTQIEITSLHTSPDTGTKTITLMQTIGTTVSRVTALLDPASSYAVETPSGVAAVRGTTMIVRIVSDDPNYPDGTVLITCIEGDIWLIWNGLQVHIAEGYTCVIRPDGLLELIPPDEPPQEESGDNTDEDTTNGQSEDQQPDSSTTGSWPPAPMTPPPVVVYSDPPLVQTSPPDGGTPPPGGETTGRIHVITPADTAPIFIQVETAEGEKVWATDLGNDWQVDGTKHYGVSDVITLAANQHYYVWVGGAAYYEDNFHGWESSDAPEGYDGHQADGELAADHQQNLKFQNA